MPSLAFLKEVVFWRARGMFYMKFTMELVLFGVGRKVVVPSVCMTSTWQRFGGRLLTLHACGRSGTALLHDVAKSEVGIVQNLQ